MDIIIGYRFAVAYNFNNLAVYEFDKAIGELLVKHLPCSEENIIDIAIKNGVITYSERSFFKRLLSALLSNKILQNKQKEGTRQNMSNPGDQNTTLVIEILTKCDFNCRHCYLGERLHSNNRIELPAIRELLRGARELGIDRVQITGGNPSLHPNIVAIIELLSRHSFEIIYFSNGMNLTDKILTALEKSNCALHVSVYGMSNESGQWLTGNQNYYHRLMRSLKRIESSGVKIRSLDFMAVERNSKEIELFIEFCKARKYPYRFDSPAAVGNAKVNKIKSIRERIIDIKLGFDSPEVLKSFRLYSCQFDQPTVLANGDVTFCILGNLNFDDFILGNIYEKCLKEIWLSKRTTGIFKRTEVNNQIICRNCDYKYLCGGICPFLGKFFNVNLTEQGIPDCPQYQDKRFRPWGVQC